MEGKYAVKYHSDLSSGASFHAVDVAVGIGFNSGEVKLTASMSDDTVVSGFRLNGLALAVEKPESFIIDYSIPNRHFRIQFKDTFKISDKRLNVLYTHNKQRTMLDGTLVIDSASKISASHIFGSGNLKLAYTYDNAGVAKFEPSYDLEKDSWSFAISKMFHPNHTLRLGYESSNQNLSLDWLSESNTLGSCKISARFNSGHGLNVSQVTVESCGFFNMKV